MSYKQKFGLSRDTSKENYEKNFPGSRIKYEDTKGLFDDNIVAANNKKSNIDLGYYETTNKDNAKDNNSSKKITSSDVSDGFNLASFLFKGASSVAMTMLGSTNAYGGQAHPSEWDNDGKKLQEKDDYNKAIQGMSKKEIKMYDQKLKIKKLPLGKKYRHELKQGK